MYQHDHRTGGARFEIIHLKPLIAVYAVGWLFRDGAGRIVVRDFEDG
jgi:hypothetical protein